MLSPSGSAENRNKGLILMKWTSGVLLLTIQVLAASLGAGAAPGALSPTDGKWHHTRNTAGERPAATTLKLSEEAWRRGDRSGRLDLLKKALDEGLFEGVVRLELGEMLHEENPARSVELILPLLRSAPTHEMKEGAFAILENSVDSGLDAVKLKALKKISHLSRSFRRRLGVLTADAARPSDRRLLVRAISTKNYDLPSLRAARKLLEVNHLNLEEMWHVAQSLYRHALYPEAAPILRELATHRGQKKRRRSEAAYLLGRCLFRQAEYSKARSWYLRALKSASDRERRASLQVHIARCYELEGDLNQAIVNARQAVLTRRSDARRLFLARLRLRTHRPDLAALGISRISSSSKRSRGALLMALFSMAEGKNEAAMNSLRRVSSSTWKGPAGVIEAEIQLEERRPAKALRALRRSANHLDAFWTWRARQTMKKLPAETVGPWRAGLRLRSQDATSAGFRALREWALLEFDRASRTEISRLLATRRPSAAESAPREIRGLAGKLFRAGLSRLALRWDPEGFPKDSPGASLWTATQARDFPQLAIRFGDRAWRQWGSDFPIDSADPRLLAALYPLPHPETLQKAVKGRHFLHQHLLAAIAREESRWNPRALSVVGARGLLQLMPATADGAAKREGLNSPNSSDLFQWELNLRLGASELEDLLRHFQGFSPAAIAAYNAGTDQAELWKAQCGDSCSMEQYVLTIGFDATRDYTADVLLAESVYELMERNAELRVSSGPPPPTGQSTR